MAQPIPDDSSISVGDTMRYMKEGHIDIVKVTRILDSFTLFPESDVELGAQRKLVI